MRGKHRYLVAVTSDLRKVCRMVDKLLPLVSPRDSVVLVHIVDENLEDIIAGETEDIDKVGAEKNKTNNVTGNLRSSNRHYHHSPEKQTEDIEQVGAEKQTPSKVSGNYSNLTDTPRTYLVHNSNCSISVSIPVGDAYAR